jgi:hypothetical protein
VVDASKCCFAQHGFQRRSDRVRKIRLRPSARDEQCHSCRFCATLAASGYRFTRRALSAAQGSSPQKGEIFDNMLLCIRAETGLITQLQHGRLVRLSAHKTQFR